jgi:hypothetical protein
MLCATKEVDLEWIYSKLHPFYSPRSLYTCPSILQTLVLEVC